MKTVEEVKANNRVLLQQCKDRGIPDHVIGVLHSIAWDEHHSYGEYEVASAFCDYLYELKRAYEQPERHTIAEY